MESEQQLRIENERLVAEIASIKKKVKLALKKQQAELQAKIQSAEKRAAAVEVDVNGGVASGIISQVSDVASGITSQVSDDSLLAELNAEKQNILGRGDEGLKERLQLENEVNELRKTKDDETLQRQEAIRRLEGELRLVKEDAERRVVHLTKDIEKLEAELREASDRVAEAFAQMSTTRGDTERIARQGEEAKDAHTKLATEHESVCQELEQSNAALAAAQLTLKTKVKEMEEMAAARRAAQEGQEAAMAQLMHRLDELEASGTGHQPENLPELNGGRIQLLLQEKADLAKQLESSRTNVLSLQEEVETYKYRLQSIETHSQALDSGDINHTDDAVTDVNSQREPVVEKLEFETAAANQLRHEVEGLGLAGRKESPAGAEEVLSLKKELEDERSSRQATENESTRLLLALNDREKQLLRLTQEIADAHESLDDQVRSRDDKYAELDAKFGRLQKRAKQRIQEVQKEKEDVETQLATASAKAAQALSMQASLQDDLERARFQAGEALRNLDADRQQLRASNIKLREEAEELRRHLDGKEHNLAESRRLASEKDQTALEMTATLKKVEANYEYALAEVKDKLCKAEENFKAQVADALTENNKMVETITGLQVQLGAKESKLVELETASSGEIVRLGAALEGAKGEASRLQSEHRKEREEWQASIEKLMRKLEESEKAIHSQEIATADLRSHLESDLERHRQLLSIAQADLSASENETARIRDELSAYKVRAYALLQKKESELLAAKDAELAAAQEMALKDAERKAVVASMERDAALKALHDAEIKLAAREVSVLDAEHRIRDLATKLEASKEQLLIEQDEWKKQLDQTEVTWHLKCQNLEANIRSNAEADMKHDFTAVKADYSNLKAEFETFRDLVDITVEEKDKEVARLLEENASLQRSSLSHSQVWHGVQPSKEQDASDLDMIAVQAAEQQILLLARQQAQREEEVTQCKRHLQALQEELEDLERENRLHGQQESLLKEEVRNLERAQKRGGIDMTYLKNVILKLLETGEVEALLPVVAMLLQFSPDELKRCQDTYNNITATSVPLGSAVSVVDSAVGTPRTFLSRLRFSGGI